MGDHRISFKATIEMHGVKDKCDMWLNWYPNDEYGGVDRRIAEWILENVQKAMDSYWDAQYDAQQIRGAENELQEREELARLKAKYEPDERSSN